MLSAVPRPVTVRVPAKINLHLAVGATRADGYHDLVTVFHAVSLFDEVTVEPAEEPSLEVYGDGAAASPLDRRGSGAVASPLDRRGSGAVASPLDRRGSGVAEVPLDATNLAWRAVETLAARAGRDPCVRLVLRKGIPVAGGMAGGSADAAGALVALSALWRMDLGRDELSAMAADLGSDVTFLLHGGTALGTGRGEQVVPVLARHRLHWVIALSRGGLSTAAVFGELDRLRGGAEPEPRPVEPVLEALAGGDPRQLALNLGNDMQAAAVSMAPDLRRTLRAGVNAGALAGLVSGSGPTCAFLCADADAAVDVATELAGAGVCRTVRVAQGPVGGARVVEDAQPPDSPPGAGPPTSGPGAWPPVRA